MSGIPEGVTTVTGEGRDLATAIAEAAKALGIEAKRVRHKFDMAHFRNSQGRPLAQQTVKIVAWLRPRANPMR